MAKGWRLLKVLGAICLLLCASVVLFKNCCSPQRPASSRTEYLRTNPLEAPQWLASMEAELPSVPFRFWIDRNGPINGDDYNERSAIAANCSVRFPDPMRLAYHNTYWQSYSNGNILYRLYGAYYDNRQPAAVVRVLAMLSAPAGPHPLNYCQLWYSGDSSSVVRIVPVNDTVLLWNWERRSYYLYPVMLHCPLPEGANGALPQAVTIVAEPCATAQNALRVQNVEEAPVAKDNFAVCVKGLNFNDKDVGYVARLVEWLELQRLLGADRVIVYDYGHSGHLSRVLRYYVTQGFVEVRAISLAESWPRLANIEEYLLSYLLDMAVLQEVLAYNDCFYRHMHAYRYIAMLDVDEVVMPLGCTRSWHELLLRQPQLAGECAFCFRNVYFPSNAAANTTPSKDLYMLGHTRRLAKYTHPMVATKCFHNTRHVLAAHNHFPLFLLPHAKCRSSSYILPTGVAHMQHYREVSAEVLLAGAPLLEERSIWRFAEQLRALSNKTLHDLASI